MKMSRDRISQLQNWTPWFSPWGAGDTCLKFVGLGGTLLVV